MTQIYGTLGPACATQSVLEDMFRAGMTGIRLNLSHCDLADSTAQISAFHAAAQATGIRPQLVVDTQGPELRIGALNTPLLLEGGMTVTLGKDGIPVPAVVAEALTDGCEVLLDDGRIALRVTSAERGEAAVLRGGTLTGHKSIKLPGKDIRLPVLTERDVKNLRQAADFGVTGLLQPFVRSGQDLLALRQLLNENGAGHLQIFAKIETLEGADNLPDILPYADVIVIARGDLGNDMPLWQLPAVQKRIANTCRAAGKPFLVVTQMLTSMERAAVPTRAEVSDIFNAVADGAWGVMLTGETAVGQYPAEAIRYLSNTAAEACRWLESQ
ncbi:MAG: pyruvate kinase [Ruminococcaceae bacterium]|nr:pyruvate kinase [Oscillospiraceae bacterium]